MRVFSAFALSGDAGPPLTASICKYGVCIFTLALLSTTLKPDCFPSWAPQMHASRRRLNQTRSRRRQTGDGFSRSPRCAPTYCTCVPRRGLVSAMRHAEQKQPPTYQSSCCYFPISSPSIHFSGPFSCSVAPPLPPLPRADVDTHLFFKVFS